MNTNLYKTFKNIFPFEVYPFHITLYVSTDMVIIGC
jgi:hypothetical protein